jgi:hypothetical protein
MLKQKASDIAQEKTCAPEQDVPGLSQATFFAVPSLTTEDRQFLCLLSSQLATLHTRSEVMMSEQIKLLAMEKEQAETLQALQGVAEAKKGADLTSTLLKVNAKLQEQGPVSERAMARVSELLQPGSAVLLLLKMRKLEGLEEQLEGRLEARLEGRLEAQLEERWQELEKRLEEKWDKRFASVRTITPALKSAPSSQGKRETVAELWSFSAGDFFPIQLMDWMEFSVACDQATESMLCPGSELGEVNVFAALPQNARGTFEKFVAPNVLKQHTIQVAKSRVTYHISPVAFLGATRSFFIGVGEVVHLSETVSGLVVLLFAKSHFVTTEAAVALLLSSTKEINIFNANDVQRWSMGTTSPKVGFASSEEWGRLAATAAELFHKKGTPTNGGEAPGSSSQPGDDEAGSLKRVKLEETTPSQRKGRRSDK